MGVVRFLNVHGSCGRALRALPLPLHGALPPLVPACCSAAHTCGAEGQRGT
jgi:hypothetical protein